MKKVIVSMATIALFAVSSVYAQVDKSITVKAEINGTTQLEMSNVFQVVGDGSKDSDWTDTGQKTTMDFGQLTHTLTDGKDAGLWYAAGYHCVVFLTAWTYGQPYWIHSTCNGLTNAKGTVLPKGVSITPIYWPADNGNQTKPTDAVLGSGGPLDSVGKELYNSGASAKLRTIQVHIGIPPYKTGGVKPFTGFVPIPLEQQAGKYSGSVTFSLYTS